jgi:hypothetical protein
MKAYKAAILGPLLWTSLLCAGDFSSYRGFRFGTSLEAAQKQIGASEAELVHQRPAVIQELTWWPRSPYRQEDATRLDPLREGLLRFYNGELFQIIATYERQSVEGMTEADLVKAISLAYGTSTKPGGDIAYHSNYGELARVLARWEDAEHSASLIRTGDGTSFALILSQKRLVALAQAAIAESARLDALGAPQRAIDLKKQQEADRRRMLDEARSANISNFRP